MNDRKRKAPNLATSSIDPPLVPGSSYPTSTIALAIIQTDVATNFIPNIFHCSGRSLGRLIGGSGGSKSCFSVSVRSSTFRGQWTACKSTHAFFRVLPTTYSFLMTLASSITCIAQPFLFDPISDPVLKVLCAPRCPMRAPS